jgi:exopolysaccharide production protein ExoQ
MSQPILPSALLSQLGERAVQEPAKEETVHRANRWSQVGFVLSTLLMVLATLGPFIASATSEGASEGSSFRQLAYILLLLVVLVWAAPWERGLKYIAIPIPILVALAWCWLSLIWAVEPGIAFRRLLLTTSVIWTVCILVHCNGYRQNLNALRAAMVIILVANYLAVWLTPEVGIHLGEDLRAYTSVAGNWRGLTTHKNFAGASCAFCILLFLFEGRDLKLWFRASVIVLAGIFLYYSASKTSLGMLVLASGLGYFYNRIEKRFRRFIIPIGVIVMCGISAYTSVYMDALAHLYLQPTAFTGRGQIWSALYLYAQNHAMLGAGFSSFWNIGGYSPIFIYGKGYTTVVTVGHNGYLDLLVTVGWPGLLLIVWGVFFWPLLRVISVDRIEAGKGAMLCSLLLFCIGHNVTESSLFERDSFVGLFAIFVAAFIAYTLPGGRSLSRSGKRKRSANQAGQELMAQMQSR